MAARELSHLAPTSRGEASGSVRLGEGNTSSLGSIAGMVGRIGSAVSVIGSGALIVASVVLVAVGVFMRYVVNQDLTASDALLTLFFD